MFELIVTRLDRFKTSKNNIVTVLTGNGTHSSYSGNLVCGSTTISVQGEFPGKTDMKNILLQVNSGAELLNNSFVGKTFISTSKD